MRNFKKWGLLPAAALAATWALPEPGAAQHDRRIVDVVEAPRPPAWMVMPVRLGIWIDATDPADEAGVGVAGVESGGPADKAGIREGDVVVSIAGHDLTQPLDEEVEDGFHDRHSLPEQRLRALLRELDPEEDESVEVLVRRGDEVLTFDIVPQNRRLRYRDFADGLAKIRDRLPLLEEKYVTEWALRDSALKAQERALRLMSELRIDTLRIDTLRLHFDGWPRFGRFGHGLDLVEVNPDLGAYFGTRSGVLVVDVDEDSTTGLRAGDVVVSVDGRQVDDVEKLRRILRSYEHDEDIGFGIWRNGTEVAISGTLN